MNACGLCLTSLRLAISLSGESPFQGSTDAETLALVTAVTWDFDPEFDEISDEAKDFICKLLQKERRFAAHYVVHYCETDYLLSRQRVDVWISTRR